MHQNQSTVAPPNIDRRSVRLATFALGVVQIPGYGSSYYLLGVLAEPIARDTGWSLSVILSGVSIALLVSGLFSPFVGNIIEQKGGHYVLMSGAVLLALGLALIGLSTNVPVYLIGWTIIGLGMGATLYDAAFASLGNWLGSGARAPITKVTLYGGLATLICWPLSAYLVFAVGWRSTCLIFAAFHLLFTLPILTFGTMPLVRLARIKTRDANIGDPVPIRNLSLVVIVGLTLTIAGMITSSIGVTIIHILGELGYGSSTAVLVGSLIGPMQIVARLVELAFSRIVHPLWSAMISAGFITAGLLILASSTPVLLAGVPIYAVGAGLTFVIKGTLPLALFGESGYASLIGKLAVPTLVAQAAAPYISAILVTHWSVNVLLAAQVFLGMVFMALVGLMVISDSQRLKMTT